MKHHLYTGMQLSAIDLLLKLDGVHKKSSWRDIAKVHGYDEIPPLCAEYETAGLLVAPQHVKEYIQRESKCRSVIAVIDLEKAKKLILECKPKRISGLKTPNKRAIKTLQTFLKKGEIVKGIDWSIGNQKGEKMKRVPIFCRKYFKAESYLNPEHIKEFFKKNPTTKTAIALEDSKAAKEAIKTLSIYQPKQYKCIKYYVKFSCYKDNIENYKHTTVVVNYEQYKKQFLTEDYVENYTEGALGFAVFNAVKKCFGKKTYWKAYDNCDKFHGCLKRKRMYYYVQEEQTIINNVFITIEEIPFYIREFYGRYSNINQPNRWIEKNYYREKYGIQD